MPILTKKTSTISLTGAFFLVAMALTVAAALFSYRGVMEIAKRSAEEQRTHHVLLRMEETHSTLRDLVSSARGYALSGRHEYLLSFELDRNILFEMLDGLRVALRNQQGQLDKLAQLSTAIARRVEMSRTLIEADRSVKIDNVDEHGRDLSEDIRKQFVALKDAEQQLLQVQVTGSRASMEAALLAIIGAAALSAAVLVAVYLRLRREILSRKETLLRAQLAETDADALYNHAPCGYHSINEQTHLITRINDTELTWLGYRREQVVGKMSQTDLMTVASASAYGREVRPRILAGKVVSKVELEYRHADSSQFAVMISISSSVSHHSGALLSHYVVHDIAERRRAQQQIEQLNASLKRHALQLTNINKELESFSYSVSHDLRAPLRAISGYALMLEEDYGDALGDKGQEMLLVVGKNVKKMDTLINDLLKLSKSTTAELTLNSFSMHEQVKQAVATLRADHSKIDFVIEPLENAPANQALLAQVWENLLSNAVKFSAKTEQPQIRISAQVTPQEVVYQVQDNGIGFDMRYVHKLFGTFQRLHRQEEYSGTGIGLALVQRIVVRHGGRVWAESTAGQGARFYFALPRTAL